MFAFAFGLAHRAADGTVLDVFFPAPVRAPDAALAATVTEVLAATTAPPPRTRSTTASWPASPPPSTRSAGAIWRARRGPAWAPAP